MHGATVHTAGIPKKGKRQGPSNSALDDKLRNANRDTKIKAGPKFFKTIEKRFSNRDSHGCFLRSLQHAQSFTLTTLGDGHAMPSISAASPAASMKVEKLMDTLFNGLKGGFS